MVAQVPFSLQVLALQCNVFQPWFHLGKLVCTLNKESSVPTLLPVRTAKALNSLLASFVEFSVAKATMKTACVGCGWAFRRPAS